MAYTDHIPTIYIVYHCYIHGISLLFRDVSEVALNDAKTVRRYNYIRGL